MKYFSLFTFVRPVNGKNDSVLCNLPNHSYIPISNLIYQVISRFENEPINSLYKDYGRNVINHLTNTLLTNKLGFFTNKPSYYHKLNTQYFSPHSLLNAIIELDNKAKYSWKEVLLQLHSLGCQNMELRIFSKLDPVLLSDLINEINNSRLCSIDIILEYSGINNISQVGCFDKTDRVRKIILTSYTSALPIIRKNTKTNTKKIINSEKCLNELEDNFIKSPGFVISIEAFCDAKHHNLALNRNICIDREGNIKNYPTHSRTFGNVNSISLVSVLENVEFTESWFINNDHIAGCKDCQYRYICFNPGEILKTNSTDYSFIRKNKCQYVPA
jgi:SPASM domain peptide maturase of grasp-with-spasm system